jgi:hypothetical protein
MTQLYGAALGIPSALQVVINVTGKGKVFLNFSGFNSIENAPPALVKMNHVTLT